jgi:hypothetical protein
MKEIKEIFQYIEDNRINVNPSQIRFIETLKKYYKRERSLSDKQLFILHEIRNYVQIEVSMQIKKAS